MEYYMKSLHNIYLPKEKTFLTHLFSNEESLNVTYVDKSIYFSATTAIPFPKVN